MRRVKFGFWGTLVNNFSINSEKNVLDCSTSPLRTIPFKRIVRSRNSAFKPFLIILFFDFLPLNLTQYWRVPLFSLFQTLLSFKFSNFLVKFVSDYISVKISVQNFNLEFFFFLKYVKPRFLINSFYWFWKKFNFRLRSVSHKIQNDFGWGYWAIFIEREFLVLVKWLYLLLRPTNQRYHIFTLQFS